jgi:hypothetical protein
MLKQKTSMSRSRGAAYIGSALHRRIAECITQIHEKDVDNARGRGAVITCFWVVRLSDRDAAERSGGRLDIDTRRCGEHHWRVLFPERRDKAAGPVTSKPQQ